VKLLYLIILLALLPEHSFGGCREWLFSISPEKVDEFDYRGEAPLHRAVRINNLELVKSLLEKGANPNLKDKNFRAKFENFTPLHIAAFEGRIKIVQLLVQYGADPLLQNYFNKNSIESAAKYGHLEILKFFLGRIKFDPSSELADKLLIAAVEGGRKELIESLVDRGVQLLQTEEDLFRLALLRDKFKLAFWLYEQGVNLRRPEKSVVSPSLFRDIHRVGFYFLKRAYQQKSMGQKFNLRGISLVIEILVSRFKNDPIGSDHLYPLIKGFQNLEVPSVWLDKKVLENAEIQHERALNDRGLQVRFEDKQEIIYYGRLSGLLSQNVESSDLLKLQFRRHGSLEAPGFRLGLILPESPERSIPKDLSRAWLYLDLNGLPRMKNTAWQKLGLSDGPKRVYYVHEKTREVVSLSLMSPFYEQKTSSSAETYYLSRFLDYSFDESIEGKSHAKVLNQIDKKPFVQ